MKKEFKATLYEKAEELMELIRTEYPGTDYFSLSYLTHDYEPEEDRLPNAASIYLTVVPLGEENADISADSDLLAYEEGDDYYNISVHNIKKGGV